MRFIWLAPLIATLAAGVASAKTPTLACAPVKVHFALDSDQLYDSEKPLLDSTAQCLKAATRRSA